jgi:hypothetical protein
MNQFWVAVLWILGLIGLYLVLVHAGGAAKITEAIANTTVNETIALQGGYAGAQKTSQITGY